MIPSQLVKRYKKVIILIWLISLIPSFYLILSLQSREAPEQPVPSGSPLEFRLRKELGISLGQVNTFKSIVKSRGLANEKANATFLALSRNSELGSMVYTLRQVEATFNSKYKYPYVFLNDEPFSKEFKDAVQKVITSKAYFGLIPKEHWSAPEHMDKERLRQHLERQAAGGVPYGGVESYHNMCRFYSGFFYKHPLLASFDYYWRVSIHFVNSATDSLIFFSVDRARC